MKKGDTVGQWKRINDFIQSASNGAFTRFWAYSTINDPMTSCGCFEWIACVLPGTGGIMLVDWEYQGQTPVGMPCSSLAEMTGGGQQTPGFIGIGTLYLLSKVHQRRRRAGAAGLDHHAGEAETWRPTAEALRRDREARTGTAHRAFGGGRAPRNIRVGGSCRQAGSSGSGQLPQPGHLCGSGRIHERVRRSLVPSSHQPRIVAPGHRLTSVQHNEDRLRLCRPVAIE